MNVEQLRALLDGVPGDTPVYLNRGGQYPMLTLRDGEVLDGPQWGEPANFVFLQVEDRDHA